MNILIITTYFPPDSAIAAVRPYMFAKYLSRFGHRVTVLRSGRFCREPDHSYPPLEGVRVISYLGKDSPAEIFERGEALSSCPAGDKSRISFLPERIRLPIAERYHSFAELSFAKPWVVQEEKRRIKALLNQQREALRSLQGEGNRFDIVFATYGDLENFYAGKYAAELFGCPWILDLRDPIATPFRYRGLSLLCMKHFQNELISQADACTVVSNGIRESSAGLYRSTKTVTIYNGYEPFDEDSERVPESNILSFCYTGTVYRGKDDVTVLLNALKQLESEGKIDLARIRIEYAGPNFLRFRAAAKMSGTESCIIDHGYVSRKEADQLQKSSDIFLLLSWNARVFKGGIGGKFYEGIRCGRPILALVTGNASNSELYELNEKYHYGFCYEECRHSEQFSQLCDFLLRAYQQKMENGYVNYAPSEEFSATFHYNTLSRQLESLCEKLIYERS